MSDGVQDSVVISQRALVWALKELCLWREISGEKSADPYLRGEAAYTAKITINQLAYQVSQEKELQ